MSQCLIQLQKKLYLAYTKTAVPSYNFDFELFFECKHPIYLDHEQCCILRIGAISDYVKTYNYFLEQHLRLVNNPQEHLMGSELPYWYPLISDLTPESIICDEFPPAESVQAQFGWPVFIKGARQSSKHNPKLCIAKDAKQYQSIIQLYQNDPILHWQKIVIRRYIPLKPLLATLPDKVPPSVEFRTFWWHGECVGWGHYWHQLPLYQETDIEAGLNLAKQAALRLQVPFLVIDIAKAMQNRWIIIECNDAQESGYTGVTPQCLWQNIIDRCSIKKSQ